MEVTLLLVIGLIAANLPFLLERLFFIKAPSSGSKHLGWRLLELVVLYFVVGGIGLLLEKKGGEIHPQGWEFYAVTFSLFLVFAFPGFIYRYLWRKKGT